MSNPILLFRIGYMEKYDGPGKIVGGGGHIKEYKEGGEMWNFLPESGRCYGYVMTKSFSGLNLNRIVEHPRGSWEEGEEYQGIDIGFFARRPDGGQVIVGAYLNATVFHKQYRERPSPKNGGRWKDKHGIFKDVEYLCEVDADRAFLLPEKERTWEVPSAPKAGKGLPGQSNVWYGNSQVDAGISLATRVSRYINNCKGRTATGGSGWKSHPDNEFTVAIENAAMKATEKNFVNRGYAVEYVHKDNLGWDMIAKKEGKELQLEVKGHFGNVIQFELTPNEYAQLKVFAKTYRVCVVRNALVSQKVEIYTPQLRDGMWRLIDKENKISVGLEERVAAKAFQMKSD
ncbi:hypothetical protein APZ41_021495 [Roseomonas mucosa]|uniref:Protein NO VEIN C-terminal domain-containing protein n=2 Tax=Roseomonas mucosa TaxID=207340 RepID=A0A1S8CYI5_9PROT|nr:hypothetical protein APZ41_021495 [Roseomonas mucosa]